MKRLFILIVVSFVSCKKNDSVSSETKTLIQNKWTLISEEYIYQDNPIYDAKYQGQANDYYLFSSRDTLYVHQNGSPDLPTIPRNYSNPYKITSNSSIMMDGQYGAMDVYFTIQKLSSDSLIFTNPISYSVGGNGNVQTYNGLRKVVLAK